MDRPDLFLDLLHPDDVDRVVAEVEAANAAGEIFSGEYRMRRRDGRYIWVHEESIPVRDNGGEPYALGYVAEITRRKEGERRLAAQHAVASVLAQNPPLEEGARRVLESVCTNLGLDVGVLWKVDPEAGVLRLVDLWHPETVELPDFEALTRTLTFERGKGLAGSVWSSGELRWELIRREHVPRGPVALREGLRAAFGSPISARSEVLGVIEFFSARMDEPDDELLQMMGVLGGQLGQFFERTEAEAQLRHSEQRFRQLIETANDAFVSIDADGVVLDWNRSAERLFGWKRDQVLGRRLEETVIPPQYRDAYRRGLEHLLATGEGPVLDRTMELTALDRTGVEFPVELTIWRTAPGADVFNAFVRDIRERRLLEEELRQSQKLEAVGRLAGGIAHDFNNLLLAIRGHAELALGSLPDEPEAGARESIEQLVSAADRAAALTRQLLAFSRKQILKPVTVDLNAIVVDLAGLIRPVLGEPIDFVTAVESEPFWIEVDPVQLEQAILNVAINARDAMPDGGTFSIMTRWVEFPEDMRRDGTIVPAGPYVELSLADTGFGMNEALKAQMFEPFFTTKAQGTGLGLSTVYGFVNQSRGYIFCLSAPGAGTTFSILLPAVGSPAEAVPDAPARTRVNGRPGQTILVAEDEDVVRRLLRTVLEGAGYAVLEAKDGEEALLVADRHQGAIDLLVTDLVMPGIDGRQTADALSLSRPGLSVVYLSGYADEAVVARLPVDACFLEKPFPPGVLVERVRAALDPGATLWTQEGGQGPPSRVTETSV